MKKYIKLLILLFVICIAGFVAYHYLNTKVKFNSTYVNGNLSGNLYNAGLFCESNGEIFFSNPNDNGRLYAMNVDGSNVHKLCNDSVMYINADKNFIYYVRNNTNNVTSTMFFAYDKNSLCRIKRTGGKAFILDKEPCIYASLIGNYIYYLHYDTKTATTLYRVKIDGTEKKQVYIHYLFTCNASGQYFYYNNPDNGQLFRYDTASQTQSLFYDCNCYKPVVMDENNIFYMDVDQNNAIVHVNVNNPNPVVLTEGNIEHFNVYGSKIFYQRGGDDAALCMVKDDGTGFKELAKGEYSSINVTSQYVYFTDFSSNKVYYTSISNPGDIKPFN